MWSTEPIPAGDKLRQGDLLVGAPMYQLGEPGPGRRQGTQHLVETQIKTPKAVMVVSHCCTNDRQGMVTVAPVELEKRTAGNDHQWDALMASEPGEDGQSRYAIYRFALPDAPGMDDVSDRGVWATNLTRLQTFKNPDWLLQYRVGRLTPRGRLHLRINLYVLWARPEEDDIEKLTAEGIDPVWRPGAPA